MPISLPEVPEKSAFRQVRLQLFEKPVFYGNHGDNDFACGMRRWLRYACATSGCSSALRDKECCVQKTNSQRCNAACNHLFTLRSIGCAVFAHQNGEPTRTISKSTRVVVLQAAVIVTDTATNQERPAVSDDAGRFTVGNMSHESAKKLVATMLTNENYEASHKGHYMYLSTERSDRTGGHLWTEKVVETSPGKVRMLVAEDGQPLIGDRLVAEKARLAEIAADPDELERQQGSRKDDERHAKEMLDSLPKLFLFENERQVWAVRENRFRS